jgi:elongation factor Ts
MHVAASNPIAVAREEIPADIIDKEKEIYIAQIESSGKKKPPEVVEKIISGKLDKYYSEVCLLEQAFVKDPDKTVKDLVVETASKLGENIIVRRFSRLKVGEE